MEPRRPGNPLSQDSLPNEDSRLAADSQGGPAEAISAEPEAREDAAQSGISSPEPSEPRSAGGDRDAAESGAGEISSILSTEGAEDETAMFLGAPEALDHDEDAVGGEAATVPEDAVAPTDEGPAEYAAAAPADEAPAEHAAVAPTDEGPAEYAAAAPTDEAPTEQAAASVAGQADQPPSTPSGSAPPTAEASPTEQALEPQSSESPATFAASESTPSAEEGEAESANGAAPNEEAALDPSAEEAASDAAVAAPDSAPPSAESPEPHVTEAASEQSAEEAAPEVAAAPPDPEAASGDEEPLARPWLSSYPDEVPHRLKYPDQSIAQFLLDSVNRYPDHKALHFLGKTMTYRELHTASVRLASELVALGVAKGDRVAIMLPNCPQAVVSYYGVLLAGAVVVQTNPLYVERELEHQLKDSGAIAIITVDLLYGRLSRVRGERPEDGPIPGLRHAIITSIADGLPFPKNLLYPIKQRKEGFKNDIPYGRHGVLSYKKLLSGRAPSVELPLLASGDELAALQYTGGTTGTPKGVMLTHGNFVSNTLQMSAWCYKAEDGKEKFLAALPLFHVFGLTVLMNLSVLRAGMLILLPRFEIDTVLKTINDEKPTIFPGAPTMYVALINHPNAAKNDLSSIKICVSGSSALPLEVQEQFESLTGGRLVEGYGLTETSPVANANPIWGKRKIGTIGLPFPDTEVAIVDPVSGRRLRTGEMGELIVRGPQVMKGYWNRPEETAATLRDGWLHTGDLATMDEEGYFTIMDRIKDVIIASGFNVYPREVEEVLFEHPAVREAAVIGVKDEYRGESVKAFIVLKEGWHVSRSQLDRWCRDRLAAYKVPHHYAFRETLPKTMVGKVLRRKLVEEDNEQRESAKEE